MIKFFKTQLGVGVAALAALSFTLCSIGSYTISGLASLEETPYPTNSPITWSTDKLTPSPTVSPSIKPKTLLKNVPKQSNQPKIKSPRPKKKPSVKPSPTPESRSIIHPGSRCKNIGDIGVSKKGKIYTCESSSDGVGHWKK